MDRRGFVVTVISGENYKATDINQTNWTLKTQLISSVQLHISTPTDLSRRIVFQYISIVISVVVHLVKHVT